MRDLTEEEINEYFSWAKRDHAAADFHREQTALVGRVALEYDMFNGLARKIQQGLEEGCDVADLAISLWVWAFQMGRECESRLLTLALKGEKP